MKATLILLSLQLSFYLNAQISESRIKKDINFLADDKLKGRGTSTP